MMKKSLIQIILANLLYLILVAGNNFLLPQFTSVETYAAVKEYTLYLTTYSTILTFGYVQGMYLHYGGKEVDAIGAEEIGSNVATFLVVILPISILFSALGLWRDNVVLTAVGIGLFSSSLCQYYQMFYQATGDFKSYGTALNASRVLVLAANIFFIFVCKTDNKLFYVGASPLIGISAALYLTIKLNNRTHFLRCFKFSISMLKENIHDGFVLMLSEFATKFFTSIDRWFVKNLMSTFNFAMYSFAVSMENLVNTFMTPITVSMYNYFCKKPDLVEVRRLKDVTLIYSMVIIAGAFPCKWILEVFMQNYLQSVSVMYLLFAAQGISAIIRGIYVNKYKAEGRQRKYFHQMLGMLILSAVLNGVSYYIGRSMIWIAVATLVTNIIWLILCETQNPELRYDGKTVLAGGLLLCVYFIVGYQLDAISGCIIYCLTGVVLGMTFMRKNFLYAVQSLFDSIKK